MEECFIGYLFHLFKVQNRQTLLSYVIFPSFISIHVHDQPENVKRHKNKPRREKTGFLHMRKQRADQLRGNREADQRLCFRYTDSTIPLLSRTEISII